MKILFLKFKEEHRKNSELMEFVCAKLIAKLKYMAKEEEKGSTSITAISNEYIEDLKLEESDFIDGIKLIEVDHEN